MNEHSQLTKNDIIWIIDIVKSVMKKVAFDDIDPLEGLHFRKACLLMVCIFLFLFWLINWVVIMLSEHSEPYARHSAMCNNSKFVQYFWGRRDGH